MIAHNNDDRIRISPGLFQESDQISQRRVRVSNFAVVEVLVFLRIRRRRLVRIMGIEQVYPNKSWSAAMFLQPTLSVLHNLHAPPFDSSEAIFTVGLRGKIVVEIKAPIESRSQCAAIEYHGTDERRSLIPL